MKSLELTDDTLIGAVREASLVLRAGGVILYPTDTVYGLGADATSGEAVGRIRAIKQKGNGRAILAMVSDMDMLERYAVVTPNARKLAQAFLPGPLSLVLDPRDVSLRTIASPDGSVGFRMPRNEFCLSLVRTLGQPVTSTSANRSGVTQSHDIQGMLTQLSNSPDDVDLVIDAGTLPPCEPSTVVDVRHGSITLVRKGAIPLADIVRVVGTDIVAREKPV